MSRLDPRIHQVLDGELPRAGLPAALDGVVERLERAAADAAALAAAPSVAGRVMAAVRLPAPGRAARVWRWFTARHFVTLEFRPVWSLALAVLLAALLFGPGQPEPALGAEEGVAQFVARFPEARSVAVVGPFNDWSPEATPLRDDDRDGVWNADVILPVGQHEYMFVVDGARWVSDPLAGRWVDDGFGRRNALVFVRAADR